MSVPLAYRVRAHNAATESENRIHDDDVARRYGFAGGLVPGVTVFAYMTRPVVAAFGREWLERGTMSARFLAPAYEGDLLTLDAVDDGDGGLTLGAVNQAGETCATGRAALPPVPDPTPGAEAVPVAALPVDRKPADATTLAPGTVLGSLEFGFRSDRAGEYLSEVADDLAVYRDERVAHPGWLLLAANHVLGENVRLGPWIHVESGVSLFGLVRDGETVSTRARVLERFERRGHHFVVLDVLYVVDGVRAVMRVRHTAIYEPRVP